MYLRAVYSDTTTAFTLVTSKTKVAPLKPPTIPRLEPYAAHLLGILLSHTAEVLGITLSDIYTWTDSAITLGWLNLPPHHLKVFVANRVADTVSKVPADHWRHENGYSWLLTAGHHRPSPSRVWIYQTSRTIHYTHCRRTRHLQPLLFSSSSCKGCNLDVSFQF